MGKETGDKCKSYFFLKKLSSARLITEWNVHLGRWDYAFRAIRCGKSRTSRDRPKSAPYPRLKNSKKTSKCQVFPFTVLKNRKFYEKKNSKKLHTQKNGPSGAPGPASASPWRAEMGTLPNLSTFLSQLKGFCRKTAKN